MIPEALPERLLTHGSFSVQMVPFKITGRRERFCHLVHPSDEFPQLLIPALEIGQLSIVKETAQELALDPLVKPYISGLTFIFTTGDRFEAATEISDLFKDESAAGYSFVTLKETGQDIDRKTEQSDKSYFSGPGLGKSK